MTKHFFVIFPFLNGSISAKTSLINTKLGDFEFRRALSDYVDQELLIP